MLATLKAYFNITDTSQDAILTVIIDNVEDLMDAFGINSSLEFSMCVEDYSNYLKTGSTEFQTAQPSEGLSRYSSDLFALIKASAKVRCF